jgi:hypothetical protein
LLVQRKGQLQWNLYRIMTALPGFFLTNMLTVTSLTMMRSTTNSCDEESGNHPSLIERIHYRITDNFSSE